MNSTILNEWREQCKQISDKCLNCYLYDKCVRCPGLAFMEDGNLYGCSSSAKRIAEQRK